MIYLIGGPPRCGKTTLARKLSKELNVAWLSGDTFEGFTKGFFDDREKYVKHFPKNVIRELTYNSNDEMYSKYSTKEILDSYIAQGQVILHMVEVLIEEMILEKIDFIIEGYHLTPAFVYLMQQKYGTKNFKSLFLVKTNIDDALKTIRASKDSDDWVHTKTTNPEIHHKIAELIVEYSKYSVNECEKNKIRYLDYKNSQVSHLNKAVEMLME